MMELRNVNNNSAISEKASSLAPLLRSLEMTCFSNWGWFLSMCSTMRVSTRQYNQRLYLSTVMLNVVKHRIYSVKLKIILYLSILGEIYGLQKLLDNGKINVIIRDMLTNYGN